MRNPSENWDELRLKVLGLGDSSIKKTHYPSLRQRLAELERFRSLVDISSDLLFVLECPSGRIVDVSAGSCERLGVDREFLLSCSFADLIRAADSDSVREQLEQLCNGIQENRLITTELGAAESGNSLSVEIAARSLDLDGGHVAILAARDITERRKAEERILKLNRLYRVITEVNKTITKAKNCATLFREVCRLCVELGDFGLARIALFDDGLLVPVAWAGADYCTQELDCPGSIHPCADAARAGRDYVCNQLADDSPCHAEALRRGYRAACAVPLHLGGKPAGMLALYSNQSDLFDDEEVELLHGVAFDISFALDAIDREKQRRLAERLQQDALRKIEAIFAASPLAIAAVDSEGRVIVWNKTAEQLFGWTSSEVIGRPLAIVPEHRRHEHEEILQRVLRGQNFSGELKRIKKDGAEMDVSISVAPLRDSSGRITGGIAMYTDIRERKRMETQLLQASKLESIGGLAGGVAHDFNNLLTVINGHTELLLQALPAEHELRSHAGEILKAGQRAAELTRQLLAFSRAQVLQPAVLPVNTIIADMEDMLRRLIGEDVQLVTELAPDTGAVKADHVQLQQVIMNLVVNARDAISAGGTIAVRTGHVGSVQPIDVPAMEPGEYVTISVHDDGVGMDEETQKHIFEPFFTTKQVGKGTGLGLSTVWGIVKQSGGQIMVSSEPLRGTTFTIYLPRVQSGSVTRHAVEARALPQGTETLMMVEDRDDVRLLTAEILRQCGYNVLEARNPSEAITLWQSHHEAIQLIISDVVMPEMTGPEMMEQIRALQPDVRVLYVSGHGRASVLDPGAAFLEKPYSPGKLASTVRLLLHPAVQRAA